MSEQKKRLKPWIPAVVVLISFLVSIIAFVWRMKSQQSVWIFACVAIFYVFLFSYAFAGYKKPHGNMVQVLMLILAVYVAASFVARDNRWSGLSWIIVFSSNLAAVFIGFMAGRLNKVEENKYTAILVSVLLLIRCLWFLEKLDLSGADVTLFILERCLALFMWLSLVLLYFFRYQEHREAGLIVDNKK